MIPPDVYNFEKQQINAEEQIPEEMFFDKDLQLIQYEVGNGLIYRLKAFVYAQTIEEQEIKCTCSRPSFLDWLLRRQRQVKFKISVKDLLLKPPMPGTQRTYIIEDETI